MITLGPVVPPKPKPKPKPKPHKIFDSEEYLYTDWDVELNQYTEVEIEVYGYVENEGFAVPEDGEYALQSGKTITISNGIVVFVS
jgi:hypothetical protein